MRILKLQQGSPEWDAARAKRFTASEAPVMMAASSKMKRNELLEMKALGSEKEISDYVQKFLFDKGHEMEALARPIVEGIVGEELYPATGESECGTYLASFDGLTMMGDIVFEHKMWNEKLADQVRSGKLDAEYYWQLEHQLMVSDAEKAIFVVSDGTEDNLVYLWYEPVRGRRNKLIKGWQQFADDLANFVPAEKSEIVVGETPEDLPALLIQVEGRVKSTNLVTYEKTALSFIQAINTELQTDQDFANAEEMVKFCKKAEGELDAAKKHALSQTQSIDELFRTVDNLKEKLREKRLQLDKLVKSRKDEIRASIRGKAIASLADHLKSLDEKLGKSLIPDVTPDFGAAMKGKKTIDSLRSAVDDELAQAKIGANDWFELISANQQSFSELVNDDLAFLFADLSQLLLKDADSFKALVKSRLSEHKEAEQKRIDAERERIRQEEQTKPEQQSAANDTTPVNSTEKATVSGTNKAPEVSRLRESTPDKSDMLVAVANAFGCDNTMAAVFICETADAIRGVKSGSRLSATAKSFGDKIAAAGNKEDLLQAGKSIQTARDSGELDDIDEAWLQSQYRKKQAELRHAA
ncbi:YqaJ viral recombinase family protein [Idiomarina xiamenensis]|uniref:YqaJ viral recombinase domain-containing protein n=1 Tax=Idiomarina xiamenensis 10-D-4 TaxID=740709 RepID=K2KPH3_9GAMM|nr:YqaJ viral recombinase family protein [Idiomarina xiamenensis]EKE79445.1 hypothetical protein A10D4_12794 [Idiomarina xiamenensis 10-D-4]